MKVDSYTAAEIIQFSELRRMTKSTEKIPSFTSRWLKLCIKSKAIPGRL
jgi:hypothetical protein